MKEQPEYKSDLIKMTLIIAIALMTYGFFVMISQPIKMEGKLECNSGEIGIKIDNLNNFSLDGIKNLNCNVEYKGEMPFFRILNLR